MLDTVLLKSLQIYRASSSISKKKLTPSKKRERKVYIVAFWKFNPPPPNHQLVNGQHPIFDSMKNIKHYHAKFLKISKNINDRTFAVLFRVKESLIWPTISKLQNVFDHFDSDIETSGHRIEPIEAKDRLITEFEI